MAHLPRFDARVIEALDHASADAEAAADALRLAAEYLRTGDQMPTELAAHLAAAFEKAVAAPTKSRGTELVLALKLKYPGRRPKKQNWDEIGRIMRFYIKLLKAGKTKNEAVNLLVIEPRFVHVTETRVRRLYTLYGEAFEID